MENTNESNIEALLAEELGKLKRAVDYIEKAERAASDATSVLTEVRNDNNALRHEVEELVDSKIDTLKTQFFEQRRANREFSLEQFESIKSRVESALNEQKSLETQLSHYENELKKLGVKFQEELQTANISILQLQSANKNLSVGLVIVAFVFSVGLLAAFLYVKS